VSDDSSESAPAARPAPAFAPAALPWALALWALAALAAGLVVHGRSTPAPAFVSSLKTGPGAARASTRQREMFDVVARRFRGDRRQTGRSWHVGPAQARLRFRFMTRGPITGQAIAGQGGRVHFGSQDGFLYTLDGTGRLLWRQPLGAPVHTTALIARNGWVVVAADGGQLAGFDAAGVPQLGLGMGASIGAAPVETNDGLLVVAAGARLVAFEPGGAERWSFVAGSEIHSTPAVDDANTLYVGAQDHKLHAIGREGRLLWQFDAGSDVDSSALVADDGSIVFGSDAGRLYALNDMGELRWERQLDAPLRAPAALDHDGRLIVVTHGLRPSIRAVRLADGALDWSYELPPSDSPWTDARSGPLVDAQGNVYVGASDGKLYALDPHGQLRFSYATAGRIDASPMLSPDGTLYFGSRDGWLYALR
jgi:outer membrane protein assembly factor BamB